MTNDKHDWDKMNHEYAVAGHEEKELFERIQAMLLKNHQYAERLIHMGLNGIDRYIEMERNRINSHAKMAIEFFISAFSSSRNIAAHIEAFGFAISALFPYGDYDNIPGHMAETLRKFGNAYFPERNVEWETKNGLEFDKLREWWLSDRAETQG